MFTTAVTFLYHETEEKQIPYPPSRFFKINFSVIHFYISGCIKCFIASGTTVYLVPTKTTWPVHHIVLNLTTLKNVRWRGENLKLITMQFFESTITSFRFGLNTFLGILVSNTSGCDLHLLWETQVWYPYTTLSKIIVWIFTCLGSTWELAIIYWVVTGNSQILICSYFLHKQ